MSDQDTYRKAAAECLEIVKSTAEQGTRNRLLILACNFLDLARRAEAGESASHGLGEEFTEMRG
jgi:hypothetical protein